MANIPPEIWFHIAKFIPKEELRDLLVVNSVFFNLAMDVRYREVVISTRNTDQQHVRTLKRLSDPLIASRVYRLSLRLTRVKKVVDSDTNTSGSNIIRHQLKHTIIHIFGGSKSPRPQSINAAPTDFINEIINIAHSLTNVRELFIDLWDPPTSYNLQPLFSSFWSAFGPKLHTLSLSGILEDFRTLIDSNPTLYGLQELRVEFTPCANGVDAGRTTVIDILLPFINNLAPHLLSLKLWSWASPNLSTFFSQLAPFPVLETLNIRTPFNQAFDDHWHDASGLKNFICDSSVTLKRVNLRLNPAASMMDPSRDGPLSHWLLECISDERSFSQLQILDIYPTNVVAGMQFLLRCIQRTSNNLVELIIRDRYLQGREVEAVIDAASSCSNLTYLRMNTRQLEVALIDQLAHKLPNLDRLWLSLGNHDAHDVNDPIDIFVKELRTRKYANWKLEDIHIWQNGQEADSDVMLAIAQSVPSLTSFFSTGHMQLHQPLK